LRGWWREEEEGADRWGRAVRGRERESPGAARPSAGRESGPRRRKGEWATGKETGPWGKREMGRARLKARFAFSYFFPFLFLTNSNLFELKSNLNSNSYALTQIKTYLPA
jgi:hypothetical protein